MTVEKRSSDESVRSMQIQIHSLEREREERREELKSLRAAQEARQKSDTDLAAKVKVR